MADATIRIGPAETIAVVRQVLPVGTHVFTVHTAGNAVLSSAYVKSGAGSAVVKWYDFHSSNGEEPAARFDLAEHPSLVAGGKSRLLVTRIHNNCRVEVIVSGGSAEVMVLASLVADFPVEIRGSFLDGGAANLLTDGGLPIATYDPDDGKFYLLRSNGGVLEVEQVPSLTTPVVETETIAAANVEQAHTFPANTKQFMLKSKTGAQRIEVAYQSGGPYFTVAPGSSYRSPEFNRPSTAIYFKSPLAGLVVELESWS